MEINKMTKLITSLKARQAAMKNEGGFSLIDVVVTVAIIVALSIGGFIAYTGLVDNAKDAAVAGAADQLRTAATVAVNDEDPLTTLATVLTDFNDSSDGLTAEETDAAGVSGTGYVTVTNDADASKTKTVKVS